MITRNLAKPLRKLASKMPVVAVTGPRQSGKTTLCRQTFPNKPYVTLEALDTRAFAVEDPRGFLREYRDGAVLDEIQRAPELFSYLQGEVDDRPEPGRFVLTGSQHFGFAEAISQSLAGRIGMLNLLPPSLDELARFGKLPSDLWTTVWTGAYPRIHDRKLDAGQWLADYTATYVERDVRQLLNVGSLDAFRTFLQLVAARTAAELSLSTLGGDAGISHNTARSWLSVLEASFLCSKLPGWHRSPRKQVVKAPKIHLLDTGLACYLLGITAPRQLQRHPLRGALFESWVVSEVSKSRLHRGLASRMFHFREAKGLEVDLLIEDGGQLTAVEVKSGETVAADFFRPLVRFGSNLGAKEAHLKYRPRLVYGGEASQRRTDVDVLSWRQLHSRGW